MMTATLTAAEIAEARELIAKATKGPWETFDPEDYHGRIQVSGQTARDGGKTSTPIISDGCFAPDAAFIAASRTLVPRLLDALEEANRERVNLLRELNGEAHLTVESVDRAEKAESSLASSDAARVRAEGKLDRSVTIHVRAAVESMRRDLDDARKTACMALVRDAQGRSHVDDARLECQRRWPSAADSLFPPDEEVK